MQMIEDIEESILSSLSHKILDIIHDEDIDLHIECKKVCKLVLHMHCIHILSLESVGRYVKYDKLRIFLLDLDTDSLSKMGLAKTRTGDTFPKLTDRVKIAQDNNADLFISIHCNSNTKKTVSGSSAHILSRKDSRNPDRDLFDENLELTKLENSVIQFEDDQSSYTENSPEDQILNSLLFHANFDYSVLFAQLIVENLATNPFHKWGKGIHQNDFLLLKKMTCPAVLVETAFLSNANERQLLVSSKWQEEIAQRLFQAFKDYKASYDGSVSSEGMSQALTQTAPEVDTDEYYGIQIMSLGRHLDGGDPALKGLVVQAVKSAESSIYKYVYGKFATGKEASDNLSKVREKFPQAFVVKVNGTKVEPVK